MGVVKFVDFFVPLEETIDGQNGGSASELDLPGGGIGGALGLHGVEQIAGEDRLILAAMQAQRLMKARILLKADVSEAGEGWSDNQIIEGQSRSASATRETWLCRRMGGERLHAVQTGLKYCVGDLTVDIELELRGGGIANAHGTRAIEPGEPLHLPFDQASLPSKSVHAADPDGRRQRAAASSAIPVPRHNSRRSRAPAA